MVVQVILLLVLLVEQIVFLLLLIQEGLPLHIREKVVVLVEMDMNLVIQVVHLVVVTGILLLVMVL